MCRRTALLCLAVVPLAFAPAPVYKPRPDPSALDLARLQGTWLTKDGLEMRIGKDRLTYYRKGEVVTGYRIVVNAGTDPRSLDLFGIAGGAIDGRTYRAIYRLGTDSLTTCSNGSKEPRPTAFTDASGGGHLQTFERKKP